LPPMAAQYSDGNFTQNGLASILGEVKA